MHVDLIHQICELLVIWLVNIIILVFFLLKIDRSFNLNEKINKMPLIKYKKEKRHLKIFLIVLVAIYLLILTLVSLFEYNLMTLLSLYTVILLLMVYFEKNSIKDYLQGYRILNEDRFRVGDNIKINDISGEVIKIGLKNTIILNNEETIISIPNHKIAIVEINSITKEIAKYDFIISYESNLEKSEILLKLMTKEIEKSIKGIEGKASYFIIDDFADKGVFYRFKVAVKKENKYFVQSEIRKLLQKTFKKENIELIEVNND